jgi:hypothetical protein
MINVGTIVEGAAFVVVILCYGAMKWADWRSDRRRGDR